ncbi:MAG: HD-GYP domain-containing protein [Deltaproteobacteria bacterium]|nr:MAG: HD-GYP domain-containing protein [Deltaproteobacteria bacterium]
MDRLELEERIIEIARSFGASLKSLGLYPAHHPIIKKALSRSFDLLSSILQMKGDLALAIADETLVFEGTPIFQLSSSEELFVKTLTDEGIEGLVFHQGLTEEELVTFIDTIHQMRGKGLTGDEIQDMLAQNGVVHVTVVTPEKVEEDEDLSKAKEIYENALSVVINVMKDIRLGKIPSGKEARKVVHDMSSMLRKNRDAMLALTMLKNYDEYTYNHSVNVAVISLSIAESLSIPETEKIDLGIAALLHDVGKTQVALDLIRKPGALTLEEFEEIKKHPDEGYRILSNMEYIDHVSAKIVREHHMGYDLSGYPKPEPGYRMEPLSPIVSVSDCYDALTTLRTYQKPRTPREALELMTKMAGKSLDPAMVKVLIKTLGIYPIGTMVRLDTGEVAVVSAQNPEDSTRPKVIILLDSQGKQLEFPIHFDLTEKDPKTGKFVKTILTTVNPLLENTDPSRSVA